MSEYPFDDFSPREIAVSLVPKPSVDEGLPSDTGTGVSAGDTVGMMIPHRGPMVRRSAARHTRGLMINPPVGDPLSGLGTRGMMPDEPEDTSRATVCSFPMPEEPEQEIPIKQGAIAPSAAPAQYRQAVGMNPARGKQGTVRMQHRVESKEEQIKIGTKIEKEHFKGTKPKDKTPKEVATTHVTENPPGVNYYPTTKKPKGAGEKLTWTCKVPAPPKE